MFQVLFKESRALESSVCFFSSGTYPLGATNLGEPSLLHSSLLQKPYYMVTNVIIGQSPKGLYPKSLAIRTMQSRKSQLHKTDMNRLFYWQCETCILITMEFPYQQASRVISTIQLFDLQVFKPCSHLGKKCSLLLAFI